MITRQAQASSRRVRVATLVLVGVLVAAGCLAQAAEKRQPNSMRVGAFEFTRGNVKVFDTGMSYADREPVVINGGKLPNTMEYDLDFPVGAQYTISVKYAAQQVRPVDIFLDQKLVVRGLNSATGSWQSSSAKWEKQADVDISKGEHTVKLVCPGPCIPHIVALRFDSSKPFPEGWRRKPIPIEDRLQMSWSGEPEPGKYGFQAYVRPDGHVDAPHDYNPMVPFKRIPPPTPKAERILEYLLMGEGRYEVNAAIEMDEWEEKWQARLSVEVGEGRVETEMLDLSPDRVREMLTHTHRLIGEFRRASAKGLLKDEEARVEQLLDELGRVEKLADDNADKWRAIYDLYKPAYLLKHRVALSNPLLDFDRLLLVRRNTYNTSHIYTTYFDGSHRPGGGLHILSPVRPDGKITTLAGELGDTGIYRDPDLDWDARKVLFSHKPDLKSPCHIYEVGIDGSGLRRLSNSDYDDIDPCYLPSGKIMFVSTRCRRVVLCHNAFTVSVLCTMDPDGSNVRIVSPNTVNEFTPSVLDDGRVTYTRWEYVDKQLGNNQSLWAAHPDGTRTDHIAGGHWGPLTFWEPRQVPNSPLIVCTLAPHMPIAVGPIALVDPADRCASPAVYKNITPELPAPHHNGWHRRDVGYYSSPYPLSEDYFIVSYAYGPDDRQPNGYGVYLLDRWNNRDLIYRDPSISSFEAFPIEPRKRPNLIPEEYVAADTAGDTGEFCLMDVYAGLDGIERGTVKYLRIVEEVPKPVAARCSGSHGLQYPVMSNYGHIAVKRLWGTVPVSEDGSAYFKAPANRALYFAALDENYMEIQRMRSFTNLNPGQTLSCVGCHEPRHSTPSVRRPTAMSRRPSAIAPPAGGVHAPDFAFDVQPVLDKRCVSCHSGLEPAGGLDLSPTPTRIFNVAYENLTNKGLVNYVNVNQSSSLPLRPPKYYGSHASRLVEVLRGPHADKVKLPSEDFRRLVTWIDCNSYYYGTYLYSRPGTSGGRDLLTAPIRQSLDAVFKRRCASCHAGDTGRAYRVNFDDPLKSPVLLAPLAKAAGGTGACGEAVLKDLEDADAKALRDALTRLQAEMRDNPRMDMRAERPPIIDPDCRYVYRP